MLKKIVVLLIILLPMLSKGKNPPSFNEIIRLIPSDLEKASVYADAFLQDALQHKLDSAIAKASYALGLVYYYQDQHIISSKYFQNALNQAYAKKNIAFSEKCYNNLGVNYEILGKFDKSLAAYNQSLKMAKQRKDAFGVAQTNLNIALLYGKKGDYEYALKLNNQIQDYFIQVDNKEYIGLTYLNASSFYNKKDKLKAVENALKAIDVFENIHDTLHLIKAYSNLNKFYLDLFNYEKATYSFDKAMELSNKFQSYGFKTNVFIGGVTLNIRKGRLSLAKKLLREAEYQLAVYPNVENEFEISALKVRLNAFEGNLPEFEKSFNNYIEDNTQRMVVTSNAAFEEWAIIYEKEALSNSLEKMAIVNKNKNRTIILITLLLAILTILLFTGILFYTRLRASYRKIFQLNNALQNKPFPENEIADIDSIEQKRYSLFLEIQQLMENEKFYLKRGITIANLSTALVSNDKYISSSINKYARMNFNQYINTLRIQEAKKIISQSNFNISIQDLAMACGFGNASSFIRIFKQVTGITPAFYVSLSKESA
jgi:AraC-like DNA-binding protein